MNRIEPVALSPILISSAGAHDSLLSFHDVYPKSLVQVPTDIQVLQAYCPAAVRSNTNAFTLSNTFIRAPASSLNDFVRKVQFSKLRCSTNDRMVYENEKF
eukprot:765218-Hanusia_phi.AAC.4